MSWRLAELAAGEVLPGREFTPDNVELMLYNAALWNGHRIHFDLSYATEVEGYEGLVIAGPELGDWMAQVVDDWLDACASGEARLLRLGYSNRQAAYIGETLRTGGRVTAVEGDLVSLELFVKNAAGDVITPGTAQVRVSA